MRQILLASTCAIAIAVPAHAQKKIENATTAPVSTATANAGQPDNILITSAGSITTTSPVAVTINSNNSVTNQGAIAIGNINNATGILANSGITGSIDNSGKITIDEPYTPTDNDKDGDLDGPFALGSGRFGIHTLGAFAGNISKSGQITVEGNNSAGIMLGGPLTGNFTHDGKTSVIGDNSVGVGLSDVTGNVRLAGEISVQGAGSMAVRSSGDVTGAMTIQGKITSTGYRYTTPPSDPSKLDSDDLLQGGPAISIEGDVTKGVILAVAPKDNSTTDNDEDDDGIDDSKEGNAIVTSYGSAAALRIGSASQDVNLGAVPGTASGYGVIIDGQLLGSGLYAGVDGNALQIGGLGGNVTIAGGVGVSGTVIAVSKDKAATAVHFGAGAATPELRNSGGIGAGTSGTGAAAIATAVSIDAGASLPVLKNSGEISAKGGGTDSSAVAIVDRSGTLGLIENSGRISATGGASGKNIAIDLSANGAGTTVRQTVVGTGFAAPSITGDVRFGGGNDLFDLADGTMSGSVNFGTGNNRFLISGDAASTGNVSFSAGNDQLALSGTSSLTGNVDFGGGADVLSIAGTSIFTGGLSNSNGLAVTISNGTLNLKKAATISSLSVTDGGTIGVTLSKQPGESSALTVGGTANFGAGSKLQINVSDIAQAEGTFTVISAGTLTGGNNLTANSELLPFLYKGTLAVSGNNVDVTIGKKTTTELGLNDSESAAFDAIYAALATDDQIGGSFLGIRDGEQFVGTVRQMLPEHAGGVFEAATAGDRASARMLSDPIAPDQSDGKLSYWAGQVAWASSKNIGSTAGFKVGGWGATGGAELDTGAGRVGLGFQYLYGRDGDKATTNEISINQLGLAAHWRLISNGFQASARAGWSRLSLDSSRYFSSDASGEEIKRTMESEWKGSLFSLNANVGHQFWANNFYLRPAATLEYYKLTENAHSETGGGSALDLSVAKRTSDEVAVNGLFAAGFEFGPDRKGDGYLSFEAEVGRRQIVGGSLGKTVAHFEGGDDFVLTPEERESAWLVRLRGTAGGSGMRVVGEIGGEQRESKAALNARLTLTFGL